MPLRLVMMGTGDFAVPTYHALYGSGHVVVGLFTQPDRTGSGHHHHVNPMKELALAQGTPVFQPQNVNTPESLAELRGLDVDLCVVAAYGQILSKDLLSIPRLGAINLHASILPRHRGAAPVQYAVWKGDRITGVTIFQIDPRLDAGMILALETLEIDPHETAGELEVRLAELSAPLALRVIDELDQGTTQPVPQDASLVTRAPRIKKEEGVIDWSKSNEEIGWHVRAMQPWPTAYTFLHQSGRPATRLILLEVKQVEPGPSHEDRPAEPGVVLSAENDRLVVQTGRGALELVRVKPEGKRGMTAGEFLRGNLVRAGDRFTSSPS
ncbi:MAG: methionyl-tRNA formyltransferase [Planctomycetaceae bacterium]